jgi:hypothetical protein
MVIRNVMLNAVKSCPEQSRRDLAIVGTRPFAAAQGGPSLRTLIPEMHLKGGGERLGLPGRGGL